MTVISSLDPNKSQVIINDAVSMKVLFLFQILMSACCILGYALIPPDAEILLEDIHVTVPRDLSVTDKRFVLVRNSSL